MPPVLEAAAGWEPVDSLYDPALAPLTYPRHRSSWADAGGQMLAVAAWSGGTPAGLALLGLPSADGERELLSLFVRPAHRRTGLGRSLLDAAMRRAAAAGTRWLSVNHSDALAGRAPFDALLTAGGWSPAIAVHQRIAGRADCVKRAMPDWHGFLTRLAGRGYRADAWATLTGEERSGIERGLADGSIDPTFSPWSSATTADPRFSLILRSADGVAGWLFGVIDETGRRVEYYTGYALPRYQRLGWLVAGILDVCARQEEALGADSVSVLWTAAGNAPMRAFMDRRLRPHCLACDLLLRRQRRL